MSDISVVLNITGDGIAQLTINRPEVHNAFDDDVIEQLISGIKSCETIPSVRALVLRSNGRNFSAGADLGWMRRMAGNSHDENLEDARRLAYLMKVLNSFSKPTVALVQGSAFGGAVGLVACCDIVIAEFASRFCLSEVKIGLIPAVISPYVVRAIGERQARRYFLTAEPFCARQAQIFGLVHEIVDEADALDEACERIIAKLHANSPQAMRAAKELIFSVSQRALDEDVIDDTAQRIADIRASEEGQEGLGAFLEKRTPTWIGE
ncbi:MAG: enoyl-CoA hydratase/isomerase family protein [Candidatus Thiodiazotropha sp.]